MTQSSLTWEHVDRVSFMISDRRQHGNMGEIFPQRVRHYFDRPEIVILSLEPDVMSGKVSGENDHVQVGLGGLRRVDNQTIRQSDSRTEQPTLMWARLVSRVQGGVSQV